MLLVAADDFYHVVRRCGGISRDLPPFFSVLVILYILPCRSVSHQSGKICKMHKNTFGGVALCSLGFVYRLGVSSRSRSAAR